MTEPYLPTWATAQEAAAWLTAATGEQWPLPRLLEACPDVVIWLDPPPNPPAALLAEVFQGRREGIRAPVVFATDVARLAIVRNAGTLSMTRRPDGALLRIDPPVPFDADELRFAAAGVRAIVNRGDTGEPDAADAPEPAAWIAVAQDEARRLIKHYADKDLFPSQESIGGDVAKVLRERGIYGDGGKPLTGATVKRYALKGITSGAAELKSIATKRGD